MFKKGFTLVELVIVIAIVAILAAILIPTFSSLVVKAKQSAIKENVRKLYDEITLPERATKDSAGYDIKSPIDFELPPHTSIKIPTGIRVKMEEGWVLKVYPRSGLGFKYRLQLDNTVGVIDGDYYYSDNEGHIFVKVTNDGKTGKTLTVNKGEGFCQGIFLPFGITEDDSAEEVRNGGFGSTSSRKERV